MPTFLRVMLVEVVPLAMLETYRVVVLKHHHVRKLLVARPGSLS